MEQELRESLRGLGSAYEVWETLKALSENQSSLQTSRVRSEWEAINFRNETSMTIYLGKLEKCKRLLTGTNAAIGEGELCLKAIKLGTEWKAFTDALMANPKNIEDYNALKQRLIAEQNRRDYEDDSNGDSKESSRAMNAEKSKRKFKGKCHNCDKVGHKKQDCWAKGGGQEGQGPRSGSRSSESNYSNKKSYALNVDIKGGSELILDSGCSDHMIGAAGRLLNIKDIEPIDVVLADSSIKKCTQQGTLRIMENDKEILLEKTLLVPGLTKGLISVSRLIKKGCSINFKEKKAEILKDNQVLLVAIEKDGLYRIGTNKKENAMIARSKGKKGINSWHRIMGHLNYESLRKLQKMVTGMEIDDSEKESECRVCVASKITQFSFKEKQNDLKIGDEFAADLGFVEKVIYLCITEVISGCTKTILLKYKSEAAKEIMDYLNWVIQQFGYKIKVVRIDGGGEFVNETLKTYATDKGIQLKVTMPYTPQQNGVAERKNRTIKEMARAMIIDSGLHDSKYVADALLYATFIRNRSPTKKSLVTPLEAFTGKRPDLRYLQRFGAEGYVLIDKAARRRRRLGVLSAKAEECIFIANLENGYLVELMNGKRIRSCNVEFKEFELFKKWDSDNPEEEEEEDARDPAQKKPEQESQRENEELSDGGTTAESDQLKTPSKGRDERWPNAPKAVRWSYFKPVMDGEKASKDINGDVDETNMLGSLNERTTRKVQANAAVVMDPTDYDEAVNGILAEEWKLAIANELQALEKNGTFGISQRLPTGGKTVKCKWVFKTKLDTNGNLIKHKARLVAKGYTQRSGIDYEQTFAPVISIVGVRIILSIAATMKLSLRKYDVSNAYLYSKIDKEIYIEIPRGYKGNHQKGDVLQLKRALYGLKQSGALWNNLVTSVLLDNDLKRNDYEPSIFFKDNLDGSILICGVYVDDILLASNSSKEIEWFEHMLESKFKITKGPVDEILRIKIQETSDHIMLNQEQYIIDKAKLFELDNSKKVTIPMVKGFSGKDSPEFTGDKYLRIIGALGYAAKQTRPDIQYAYSYLSRFSSKSTMAFWNSARRVLSYLFHSKSLGLTYKKESTSPESMVLEAYVDASYLGEDGLLTSTTGLCVFLNGHLIQWKSKKQKLGSSTSSCEAEIHAAEKCLKEVLWIKGILENLGVKINLPIVINEDNQPLIRLTEEESIREGSKHLGAILAFIRKYLQDGTIKLKYTMTEENIADMFTKALDGTKFVKLRDELLSSAGVLEMGTQQ